MYDERWCRVLNIDRLPCGGVEDARISCETSVVAALREGNETVVGTAKCRPMGEVASVGVERE